MIRLSKHFFTLLAAFATLIILSAPRTAFAVAYPCTEAGLDSALAAGGTATFTCSTATTIVVSARKVISRNTVLDGGNLLTLSGGDVRSIILINSGVTATIQNMTISNGRAAGSPQTACIENAGTLTLNDSTVHHCSTPGLNGEVSGLQSFGTTTMNRCTFHNLTGSSTGMVTANGTGALITINQSTFSTSIGKGLVAVFGGTITINNSTIVNFTNSGVFNGAGTGTINLGHTIITGSIADVDGTANSTGYNLITRPGTIVGVTTGNILNVTPLLGPLADNGGPTMTHALLPCSPGINAGSLTSTFTTDQRGQPRVLNGAEDIGAFESNSTTCLTLNMVSQNEGNTGTTNFSFTATLSGTSTLPISANYATTAGTATAGTDFTITMGTINFPPGTSSRTFNVPVIGDTTLESNETFDVTLSGITNASSSTMVVSNTIINDDSVSYAINDVSIAEGNTGTTNATFTVTRNGASALSTSVNFATADGTATVADSDYAAQSGILTFAGGVTTQTVTVAVNGDTKFETNETFTVNLSGASSGTISDNQGIATITNDDSTPSISVDDPSVTEGNTGTATITFTLTLSGASSSAITVNYATANNTATTADADYVSSTGTVMFPAGTTSRTVTVTVNGDTKFEPNESFFLNLSNPTNATIADNQGTGTITNDDAQPAISINDRTVNEGNTGTVTAAFTVTLDRVSATAVVVSYSVADGTATVADNDYVAATGNLTFAPGTTTQTINVVVNGDNKFEPNETFVVNLTNPTGATVADPQGAGTITNDDTQPTISASPASVVEGNTGNATITITLTLSNPSASTVSVNYATANGTATTADNDYITRTGTLTFAPGTTTQTVAITVNSDTKFEPNETFTLGLSGATGATLNTTQVQATITNDDTRPVISIQPTSVVEGNAGTASMVFTVTLSNPSSDVVTVNYATSNGTATAGSDYTATTGALTFAAGVTSQNITVTVSGDTTAEPNETLTVTLSTPANGSLGTASAQGTITNDDMTSIVSVSPVSGLEGNTGTSTLGFVVQLSNPSAQSVTVDVATSDGTATAGSDYVALSRTVTFAPGTTMQTVNVTVNGDTRFESDETFTLTLSNPVNTNIGTPTATGTITNDDTQPSISIANINNTEGNTGTSNQTFTVTLSNPSDQTVTVNFATQDGTATIADNDYTPTSATVTFAPGETTRTVVVVVNGDSTFESDETITAVLSNATNGTIAMGTATATIGNDDSQPTISVGGVTVSEGDMGTTPATLTVVLSNPSSQQVTVTYSTVNATALSGVDYATGTGTVMFAPGETSQTITVEVNGDMLFEGDETFQVELATPTNATIGSGTGTVTITDDEQQPGLSIGSVSANEGNMGSMGLMFTVTLNRPSSQMVMVDFATVDGTATVANSDYVSTNGTLQFAPGETTQQVLVNVTGDTVFEADEDFVVRLSNAVNAAIATADGTGTITNDDAQPSLSIASTMLSEGNSGATNAVFTVTLDRASSFPVSVAYTTTDGTATIADNDYVSTSGTLTLNPGETTQTINVPVNGDTNVEPDETITITLSSPTNATIRTDMATATITNDDTAIVDGGMPDVMSDVPSDIPVDTIVDAGRDAGADTTQDAGTPGANPSGCGCTVPGQPSEHSSENLWLAALFVVGCIGLRRRAARSCQ